MTILKTVGNYTIESEKADRVSPDWSNYLAVIFAVVGGCIFGFFLFQQFVYRTNNDFQVICFVIFMFIMMSVGLGIGCVFSGCGVKITLVDSTGIVERRYFKISNNIEADAIRVKKIVEVYEEQANCIIKEKKKAEDFEKFKEKECCDAYRKVIEKVKS